MHYIILPEKQTIIFWSAKCGCTTLKNILAIYLKVDNNNKYRHIHLNKELKLKINKRDNKKIDIYKNYNIVMLIRNPYKRLVSGFLDKYVFKEHYKNPQNCKCFLDFCIILGLEPIQIDHHHFEKQTAGKGWDFYNELQRPNIKYILDTTKVNDIIKILGLNIPEIKKNYNIKKNIENNENNEKKMWSLDYNTLRNANTINYANFYNDYIKKIVYDIYKDDFIFFNNNLNMNYTI